MAFYFEAHCTAHNHRLLGGGAVQDVRPDQSRVDHEAIVTRVSKEWEKHYPGCAVHIEPITAEQYGPLHCGLPQYNVTD